MLVTLVAESARGQQAATSVTSIVRSLGGKLKRVALQELLFKEKDQRLLTAEKVWAKPTMEKQAAQKHQSLMKSLVLERKDLSLKEAQMPYCDLIPPRLAYYALPLGVG